MEAGKWSWEVQTTHFKNLASKGGNELSKKKLLWDFC